MQVQSLKKLLPVAAFALLVAFMAAPSRAQDDPPMEAGRLSIVSGTVSIQPVGLEDWGAAYANFPVGPGDRIFTDVDGRAEIEIGRTFIRIGPNSDVSMVDDSATGISIGVAQGSVHIHTLGLWPGQSVFVNTPSGSATLNAPGELRVDVFPDQGAALFTNLGEFTQISGAGGFDMGVEQGQALELIGSNPVVPQWLDPAPPDDLDMWSQQRDQQIAMAQSWQYVSPEIAGANELDASGSWMPGTPYGAIWFPSVAVGWAPYHYGHWVNHAPWGSVWVEDEPWGYAPFHYGRWVMFENRWGWIPGPVAVHPVWSPALVVFAGGIQVGGVAVSAWFPLGPGEPYRPWYPCSPAYIDQVNITNIAPSPRVHVLTTYVGFNFGAVVFANRSAGFTAVSQADFAAGRPVRQTNIVVNVTVIQHVTIIQQPPVQVNVRAVIVRPPTRPVPVVAARPALINQQGMVVTARPGFRPVAAPVKPVPPVHTLPGRRVVPPPPNAKLPPGAAGAPNGHPGTAPGSSAGGNPSSLHPGNGPGNGAGNGPRNGSGNAPPPLPGGNAPRPVGGQPGNERPGPHPEVNSNPPAPGQPGSGQPGSGESGSGQPGSGQPGAGKPALGGPAPKPEGNPPAGGNANQPEVREKQPGNPAQPGPSGAPPQEPKPQGNPPSGDNGKQPEVRPAPPPNRPPAQPEGRPAPGPPPQNGARPGGPPPNQHGGKPEDKKDDKNNKDDKDKNQ
jgi:hypothetical protein